MNCTPESFTHEIDFTKLEQTNPKWKNCYPTFKVLKITNCNTLTNFLNSFVLSVIDQTSHLFFIYIELSENSNGLDDSAVLSLVNAAEQATERPLIIQLVYRDTQKSLILFKDEGKSSFLKEDEVHPIPWKDVKKEISNDNVFKLSSLFQALSSSGCGNFVLKSMLSIEDEEAMHFFEIESAKSSSPLCLRFLQLFKVAKGSRSDVIKACLLTPGKDMILAYLDLPFQVNQRMLIDEETKRLIAGIRNSKNENILEISVECRNVDAVKYFARDFGFNLVKAAQLAFSEKCYEIFNELIDADSRFPANFDPEQLDDSVACTRLKGIITDRTTVHESIKNGSMKEVKDFVEKNQELRKIFNIDNKSALTTALEASQFSVLAFLQSKGLSTEDDVGFNETLEEIIESQDSKLKAKFREAYKDFFPNLKEHPEQHIFKLLSKTQLDFGSSKGENDYFKIILSMYEELNEVQEVQPILKAIAYSKKLKIVLDFNDCSVQSVDPTKNEQTRGTSYYSGYIYVAAKDLNKHHSDTKTDYFYQVLGTLVHEMTHNAMYLVYNNTCKPYRATCLDRKRKYESIYNNAKVIDTDNRVNSDDIISNVFECCENNRDEGEEELIVRVPHLIARYKATEDKTKLQTIRDTFSDLFSFYLNEIIPDLKAYQKKIEIKLPINRINQQGSLLNLIIENDEIFMKTESHNLELEQSKCSIVLSNAPIMTLTSIFMELEINNETFFSNIYLKVESIANNKELQRKVKTAFHSDIQPLIVLDCSNKVNEYVDRIPGFVKEFDDKSRIIIVATTEERESLSKKFHSKDSTKKFEHSWNEIKEFYQKILMRRKIVFQSSEIELNELLEANSDAMLELPVNDLLENQKIEANQQILTLDSTFIDRKFLRKVVKPKPPNESDKGPFTLEKNSNLRKENFTYVESSIEEVLVHANEKRVVTISDKAGTGKSTVLIRITQKLKETNRSSWVRFVDLKRHVKEFEGASKTSLPFDQFLVSTVFKDLKIFDQKLFLHLYQCGKTIVLLDGFDEISPTYKEIWIKQLKSFSLALGNQLWITTRSHLEQSLETTFNHLSFGLKPFSKPQQLEYLSRFWSYENPNSSLEKIDAKSKELISIFEILSSSGTSAVGAPMILSMLAKIIVEQLNDVDINNLNLYIIYEQFIKLSLRNWEEKGSLVKDDLEKIHMSDDSIWRVHEKLAIAHLFEADSLGINVKFDENCYTPERLSRIGIFSMKNNFGSFDHETFAEFLVARFICTNLNSNGSKMNNALKLLVEVLKTENKIIMRLFLDQAIKHTKPVILEPKENFEKISTYIEEYMKKTEEFTALINVAQEPCEHLIDLLAKITKQFSKETVEQMLNSVRGQLNAFELSVRFNSSKNVLTVFEITERLKQEQKQKKSKFLGKQLMHLAAMNKENQEVLTTLLNITKEILSEVEIKTLLLQKTSEYRNILHTAVHFVNEHSLKEIFTVLKDRLTKEEIKEMLHGKDMRGNNCLHTATASSSSLVIQELCKFLKNLLNDEERNLIFKSFAFDGENIFHSVARNKENQEALTSLLNITKEILSEAEIKTLLFQKNLDRQNILHTVTFFGNEHSLKEIFTVLKDRLTKEEIKEMLNGKDIQGNNCLHTATAYKSNLVIQELCKFLKNVLNVEERILIFKSFGVNGGNIFHSVARNKENQEVLTCLLNITKEILSEAEIKTLLLQTNFDHPNVLQTAVYFGNEHSLKEIFTVLKDRLTKEEIKEMVNGKYVRGNNCLYLAAAYNSNLVIQELCKFLNNVLNVEERNLIFKSFGFDGENIFHSVARNKENQEVLTSLLNITKEILSEVEIKTLLLQKTSDYRNILHTAVYFGDEHSLKEIFTVLKDRLTKEEIKEMLHGKDIRGNNCLYSAKKVSNAMYSQLWELIEKIFKHKYQN